MQQMAWLTGPSPAARLATHFTFPISTVSVSVEDVLALSAASCGFVPVMAAMLLLPPMMVLGQSMPRRKGFVVPAMVYAQPAQDPKKLSGCPARRI